jgi:hypothetical protein
MEDEVSLGQVFDVSEFDVNLRFVGRSWRVACTGEDISNPH